MSPIKVAVAVLVFCAIAIPFLVAAYVIETMRSKEKSKDVLDENA